MSELVNTLAVLGRPYVVTRSRLGAVTKVFHERFICDLTAIRELFQSVSEKLSTLPRKDQPAFAFLISYTDSTHQDGGFSDLNASGTLPIGKHTERVVMRWSVKHEIEGAENELSVTVRVSNPVNPFVFLQAALSKSPTEIDNMEFELGSTCVTVDGANQAYADEVFLRIQKWLDARGKPHPFINVAPYYARFEWLLDQLNASLFPLLGVACASLAFSLRYSQEQQLVASPTLVALFFCFQAVGRKTNQKMAAWARKSSGTSVFSITSGDVDAVTRMIARAKNSTMKLVIVAIFGFVLNVLAGIVCYLLVGA